MVFHDMLASLTLCSGVRKLGHLKENHEEDVRDGELVPEGDINEVNVVVRLKDVHAVEEHEPNGNNCDDCYVVVFCIVEKSNSSRAKSELVSETPTACRHVQ